MKYILHHIIIKTTIFILLLFVSFIGFSQTKLNKQKKTEPGKEVTQQWIKEKLKGYSYNSGEYIKYNYTISFDGNDIIIEDGARINTIGDVNCSRKFPVRDIDFISYKEQAGPLWLTIILKGGKKTSTICENKSIGMFNEITIMLEKSFKNNDLPERMTKAFNRLIELYGGKKATNEEAF